MSDLVHVIRATVDPSAAPPREGVHWVNTSTNKTWISVGTGSVSHWIMLDAASGQVIPIYLSTGSGHIHTSYLTMTEITQLMDGTIASVVRTSSTQSAHAHSLTITWNSSLQKIDVAIASNHSHIGYATALTFFHQRYTYDAVELDSPNTSDWVVNSLAPVTSDSVNTALTVRAYDDTIEEGAGFIVEVPTGTTNILFKLKGRAQTAPPTSKGVVMRLYNRQIPDNAAITSWSAATTMTTLSIPTNARYQYYSQLIPVSTLGITAGRLVQFELTRRGADANDNLAGDFNLLSLIIEFT